MSRVKGGIMRAIERHARKDKEERVQDKGGRMRSKGKGLAQVAGKDMLRRMIGDGQGCRNTDNVLRTGAPPVLIDGTSQELVKVSIVHLNAHTHTTHSTQKQEKVDEHEKMKGFEPSIQSCPS